MSEFYVPKGWQLVPEEPTPQMLDEIHLVSEFTGKALTARYRAMLAAAPAAPTADGTTSDKYRAELYDEVWQRARDMGYGNVTEALVELERMKVAAPAVQAEQEPVAHVTKGDCAFWVQWTEVGKPPRGIKIPLYLAPPAQPDASVLVEALEQFADDSNWCYDTCDISRDVAKRSLAAYRAALAGKGDD